MTYKFAPKHSGFCMLSIPRQAAKSHYAQRAPAVFGVRTVTIILAHKIPCVKYFEKLIPRRRCG